jgi:hypothetical protein
VLKLAFQFTVTDNPVLDPTIVPFVTIQKYDDTPGTAFIVYTAPLVPHNPDTGPEITPGRAGRFRLSAFVRAGLFPQAFEAMTLIVPPTYDEFATTVIIFVPTPFMMVIPAGMFQL